MKKIIALFLALTCVFALFSCGGGDEQAEAFINLVNASKPTKITTLSTLTSDGVSFGGKYETFVDGDNFEMNYRYQRPATIEDANEDGYIFTEEGKIIYKDGKYSTDGGESWGTAVPDTGAISVKLSLVAENLGDYSFSKNGYSLSTTLTAEEAEKVLGIKINGTDSVSLVVTTNGTYLTGVTVQYETATSTVVIDTSYTYNKTGNGAVNVEGGSED